MNIGSHSDSMAHMQIDDTDDMGLEREVDDNLPNFDEELDQPARVPHIEEAEEDEAATRQWYKHDFPEQRQAGIPHGQGKTSFERICDEQILHGAEVLGPFKDDEEWELAKWLIKNVGHNAAEEFLKLPMVSDE